MRKNSRQPGPGKIKSFEKQLEHSFTFAMRLLEQLRLKPAPWEVREAVNELFLEGLHGRVRPPLYKLYPGYFPESTSSIVAQAVKAQDLIDRSIKEKETDNVIGNEKNNGAPDQAG